jgi:hypothetical protein
MISITRWLTARGKHQQTPCWEISSKWEKWWMKKCCCFPDRLPRRQMGACIKPGIVPSDTQTTPRSPQNHRGHIANHKSRLRCRSELQHKPQLSATRLVSSSTLVIVIYSDSYALYVILFVPIAELTSFLDTFYRVRLIKIARTIAIVHRKLKLEVRTPEIL